jgi:hypothetical protein
MMQLTFTRDEIIQFLNKTEIYDIKTVSVLNTYTEWHNRAIDEEVQIEIAWPKDIPLENFLANKTYHQLTYWTLNAVFTREFKIKLLAL